MLGPPAHEPERASRSTPPVPTRCSAPSFMAIVARTIRWRPQLAKRDPALAAFIAECRRLGTRGRGDRDRGEAGLRHRSQGFVTPLTQTGAFRSCRQLRPRREYGTARIPAAPPTTSATSILSARRSRRNAGGVPAQAGSLELRHRSGSLDHGANGRRSIRAFSGAVGRAGQRGSRAASEQIMLGGKPQAQREINYKLRDWGVSRQCWGGCRFRLPDCRGVWGSWRRPACDRQAAGRRTSISPATRSTIIGIPHVACPQCAGAGDARNRTRWIPSSICWHSCASPSRTPAAANVANTADHWLAVDQYIGGIGYAILADLYLRSSPGLRRERGISISTSRSPACSPKARRCTRPSYTGTVNG